MGKKSKQGKLMRRFVDGELEQQEVFHSDHGRRLLSSLRCLPKLFCGIFFLSYPFDPSHQPHKSGSQTATMATRDSDVPSPPKGL